MRKHPYNAKPGTGYVAIGNRSGLRKLMRAARRSKIPDERMVIIETAEKKAAQRDCWRKMWSKPFDYLERL